MAKHRIAARVNRFVRDTPGVREAVMFALAAPQFRTRPKKGELRTLCYHRVPADAMRGLSGHLTSLRNYGEFIRPDQALDLLAGGSFDGRYFLATFDDGYQCTLTNALPVLLEHNVTALMFVTSDFLTNPPHDGFLTKDGCLQWLQAGMAIGSHTATHRRLSDLANSEVLSELTRSRAVLSQLAGADVRHFACPWGTPDIDFRRDREPVMAAAVGYSSFFTTSRGPARALVDPMCLPRDVMEPQWGRWQLRYFFGE